jgi:hypothetical protein
MWLIVPSDWTPKFGLPMTVRCERCDIERRDTLGRNSGEVESRHYTYPTGYQFHRDNGTELPTRSDFRMAWINGQISEMRKRRKERANGNT